METFLFCFSNNKRYNSLDIKSLFIHMIYFRDSILLFITFHLKIAFKFLWKI